MFSLSLLENLTFQEQRPNSEPLLVSDYGRVLRFTLNPGQAIEEHSAPHSPFFAVILQGQGGFAGEDGQERLCGPNSLVIFAPGELHSVRALDEKLVFVAFMEPAPSIEEGALSGEIIRRQRDEG